MTFVQHCCLWDCRGPFLLRRAEPEGVSKNFWMETPRHSPFFMLLEILESGFGVSNSLHQKGSQITPWLRFTMTNYGAVPSGPSGAQWLYDGQSSDPQVYCAYDNGVDGRSMFSTTFRFVLWAKPYDYRTKFRSQTSDLWLRSKGRLGKAGTEGPVRWNEIYKICTPCGAPRALVVWAASVG